MGCPMEMDSDHDFWGEDATQWWCSLQSKDHTGVEITEELI